MVTFYKLKRERIYNNEDRKLYVYQIFDKDGYCNLRKSDNNKSDIIEKIANNTIVNVLDSTMDWWFIQTKRGSTGFIHKSKLK